MHEPWHPDPQELARAPRESRQGFLEARLASSAGVWLRDVRRAAQARGFFCTGLSLVAAGMLTLSGLAWLFTGPWWQPPGSPGPVLILSVSYFIIGMIFWYAHLRVHGPRRRGRRRG